MKSLAVQGLETFLQARSDKGFKRNIRENRVYRESPSMRFLPCRPWLNTAILARHGMTCSKALLFLSRADCGKSRRRRPMLLLWTRRIALETSHVILPWEDSRGQIWTYPHHKIKRERRLHSISIAIIRPIFRQTATLDHQIVTWGPNSQIIY